MESLLVSVTGVVKLGLFVGLGRLLRLGGVLRPADGETALLIASTALAPAMVLHAFLAYSYPVEMLWLGPAAGAAVAAAVVASTLAYNRAVVSRDKAMLYACSGAMCVSSALSVIASTSGTAAVVLAAGAAMVPSLLATAGTYALCATAGPAFPDRYKHEDGGVYRGEWKAMEKEGRGVYRYSSGARYEGEWRSNVKAGRGIYFYPKGGSYEGEFAGGVPDGIGVRNFRDGRITAGRWSKGKLVEPLEVWQCAGAAQGAAEAATAARQVKTGGFKGAEAAMAAASAGCFWAGLVGIGLRVAGVVPPEDLLTSVGVVGSGLPVLTAVGMGVASDFQMLSALVPTLVRVYLPRFAAAALGSVVLAGVPGVDAQVAFALMGMSWALAASPIEHRSVEHVERFRLDTGLTDAATSASQAMSLATSAAVAVASVAATLLLSTASPVTRLGAVVGIVLLVAGGSAVAALAYRPPGDRPPRGREVVRMRYNPEAAAKRAQERQQGSADGGAGGGANPGAAALPGRRGGAPRRHTRAVGPVPGLRVGGSRLQARPGAKVRRTPTLMAHRVAVGPV